MEKIEKIEISKLNIKENKKVIIIGGGIAGVKAAFDLKMNGVEVRLIEISDYLGGRMKNTKFN